MGVSIRGRGELFQLREISQEEQMAVVSGDAFRQSLSLQRGQAVPPPAQPQLLPPWGWAGFAPGPSGAAGRLARAVMQRMGLRNNSKSTGFAKVGLGGCALLGG